jgi:hypothetical protein
MSIVERMNPFGKSNPRMTSGRILETSGGFKIWSRGQYPTISEFITETDLINRLN